MKIRWVAAVLVALALFAGEMPVVCAQDEGAAEEGEKKEKKKKKRPALKEITLVGTIAKQEKAPKKEGGEPVVTYLIEVADGAAVKLPKVKPPKKKAGEDGEAPAAINLEEYVDAKVTLVGMGMEKKKGDKTITMIKKITSVEKIEEAPEDEGAAAE